MMTASQQRDFHGLTVLVTGATSGLGSAVAFQLAWDGADVTVHGRDATRDVQTVEEIELQGGRAHFVVADLADAESIARLTKESGDTDILVNNVGFADQDLEIASFDAMFATNGKHHQISSMAGRLGLAGGAVYGASKAALASLTQTWVAEYSPLGVRVNAVAPSPIYTRPKAREFFDSLGFVALRRMDHGPSGELGSARVLNEASQAESKSGRPTFGDRFPA
jgi:NAD(P)-dependent dehydrogenase (short-subunit alcohol dehydrogenase family)